MTQAQANNGWQQAIYQNTKALGGLEVKVDRLEEKLDSVGKEVTEIKTDLSQLKTDVSQLKTSVFEIKEILKWLKWIGGAIITIAARDSR